MKISPVQGSGVPGQGLGAVSTERTSPDRIAAAKAIAAGEKPIQVYRSEQHLDPQAERIQNIRKIKMRTQVSPDRDLTEIVTEPDAEDPQGAIPDSTEASDVDATKPLSPQFAALAKQKRALQVKEREIQDREKALAEKSTTDGGSDVMARIKSDPLSVLSEAGVSYDQLTEAILNGQSGMNPELQKLQAKIDALEKGIDSKLTDRDVQAKQQVLKEMRKEVDLLSSQGEEFKHVRATRSQDDVIRLIDQTYEKTGEVLDPSEALALVEEDLRTELQKLQSALTPTEKAAMPPQQQNPQMRTLTNRDTARPQMSRRDRMIAAMNGTLKR